MADTLWDFAAACYSRADVAECCLRLQDSVAADVNMLLAAAWLAAQGRRWNEVQVRELIADCASWRDHCILPLRAVRRYLKGQVETGSLYAHAKVLELEAEIQQLHHLQAALQMHGNSAYSATPDTLLAMNLQVYLDCLARAGAYVDDIDRDTLIAALVTPQTQTLS